MTATGAGTTRQGRPDPAGLPLPPKLPGGYRQTVRNLERYPWLGVEKLKAGAPIYHVGVGPTRLHPVIPRVVFASSAQAAHDVLAGSDGTLDKQAPIYVEFRRLSPNVFNLAHDAWLPRKRALQPVFTKPRMSEYATAMSDVTVQVAEQWREAGRIDVQARSRALTSEVLGRSLFGRSLAHHADDLTEAFEAITGHVEYRGFNPIKPPSWLPTPGLRRYRAAESMMAALCEETLASVRDDPAFEAPLARRMLEARDPETGEPLTHEAIVNDLITFLLAGHDTTATTIAYALWQLGRHPGWQDAVAAEAGRIGRRTLTPADVHDLPLTVRVVHEALRMCPPALGISRLAMRDVAVDGHRVPQGWIVAVNVFALHHDPAAWEDPDVFDPDRFLPERSVGRSRHQFIPFAAGQRKCIGDHFAMLEATVAIATLARDLRFTSESDYLMEMAFTTRSSVPVEVRVEARA
jgi:cytochrome P450